MAIQFQDDLDGAIGIIGGLLISMLIWLCVLTILALWWGWR